MKARIISVVPESFRKVGVLSKYSIRHERIKKQLIPSLEKIGFKASIFPAIIGSDIPVDGRVVTFDNYKLTFGTGCIGTLMSHYTLLKECFNGGEPIMVLEDDAVVPEGSATLIKDAVEEFVSISGASNDILYLQTECPSVQFSMRDFNNSTKPFGTLLNRIIETPDLSGTAAYVVTPRSARRLADWIMSHEIRPIDGHMHTAQRAGEIGIQVLKEATRGVVLDEVWAKWNHTHVAL